MDDLLMGIIVVGTGARYMTQRALIRTAACFRVRGLEPFTWAVFAVCAGTACTGGGSTASSISAAQFSYSGATTWEITGPAGGPFTNGSADFTLSNTSTNAVSWSAANVPTFVQLNALDGVIPPGSAASVHAELDAATVGTLPVGKNRDTLRFHNETAQQPDVEIDCSLSIAEPAVSTKMLPLLDFTCVGPAGGQFQPASAAYSLSELGSPTLSWQASVGDPWVVVSPSSGQLCPDSPADITIAIDPQATCFLSPGRHLSYVDILDSASGDKLHSREVAAEVTPGAGDGGWTVFTPSADTRKVFVSNSSGNDSNSGLAQTTPKRTIAAARALLRDGFPDWLLMKCGDTWDETLGEWALSGRSLTEPMLISSYGTGDRPFLRTGVSPAIVTAWQSNPNFICIVGLHLTPHLYDGSGASPAGIFWLRHTAGLLVEDCFIERYTTNIVVQGTEETLPTAGSRHSNVRIRRNVLADSFNCNNNGSGGENTSQGIYAYGCDGLTIEENVLDHNGWVDGIPGSIPTWVRHNGYIANGNTGVILQGNIIAGTDGVQMRSGGVIENNLYLHNYCAILFGQGIDPEPDGVTGTIHNNVVLDSRDYGNGTGGFLAGGICIDMGNIVNATIDNNIFAHNTSGTGPRPIILSPPSMHGYPVERVVVNTTFSNNIIYEFGGNAISIDTYTGGASQQPSGFHLNNNIFQNSVDTTPLVRHAVSASLHGVTAASNKFHSAAESNAWCRVGTQNESLAQWKEQIGDTTSIARQVHFPDPNRTIGTYHASLGKPPTLQAFMLEARKQSKSHWRTEYTAGAVNNYIRAGFVR